MRKATYIFALLLSVALSAHGQTFQGQVTEQSSGKALDAVIVCLLKADSTHIDYTYTDNKGAYSIDASGKEVQPAYVSFNLLGYAPMIVPINRGQRQYDISMVPKVFKLKEVKITPDRIKVDGDTITYKVSGFKMPQDKMIADVLKRLPGVDVQENGTIYYDGKPINTFYIDGMDLLGGRYTLASNNLASKKVKEVQVLTNHQKIKVLKGVRFTDSAALNLVLEDDAKSQFLGAIELEGGYGDGERSDLLWNSKLLGMLFGRKQQNLSMHKSSNTGKDIEMEYIDRIEQSKLVGNKEKGILSASGMSSDLDVERTQFNNAHVLTTNQLWKTNKDTDLRLQLHYLHDEPEQTVHTDIAYFLPGENRLLTEEDQLNKRLDKISTDLSYQKNGDHTFLKSSLKGNLTFTRDNQRFMTEGSPLHQNGYLKEQHLNHTFEWVNRSGMKTFSLYSENSYDRFPQKMWFGMGFYPETLNAGQGYEGWRQTVDLQSFRSNTYTYFQHRLSLFLLRYQAGLDWHSQWLDSSLGVPTGSGTETYRPDFSNDLYFANGSVYLEPSLSILQETWRVEVSCRVAYRQLLLRASLPESSKEKEHHLLPEPKLNLQWTPNGFWSFRASATYKTQFNDAHELYGGYIFTSYRSASLFSKQINKKRLGSFTGRVSYKNPPIGWFSDLYGGYSFTLSNLLYGQTINSILVERKAEMRPNRSQLWNVSMNHTKTLSFWKSSVSVFGSYASNAYEQRIQGEMMKVHSDIASARLSIGVQPCRYLSIDWKSACQYSRLHSELPASSTSQWSHKVSCNVFPKQHWQIAWDNELYYNNSGSGKTYFADFSVERTSKYVDVKLSVRNIFNRNTYQRVLLTDMTRSVYWYNLRPREITLGISFAF